MLPLPQVIAVPLSISFVKVHVKYSLHYYYYYYYKKRPVYRINSAYILYGWNIEDGKYRP
jgi:hypothetical protein